MKKLKLQMDDLRVETFDPANTPEVRGTVMGEQSDTYNPADWTCDAESCVYGTCVETCANYRYAQPCTVGKPIACWE